MDKLDKELELSNRIWKAKAELRQEYNLRCLDLIKNIVLANPDLRFTQIIFNLGLAEDRFYEESIDTYGKLKEAIKQK